MEDVKSRSIGADSLTRGIEIERSRRAKYIDALEADIESLQNVTVRLTEAAQSLREGELRNSALKLSSHYANLGELGSSLASAQRKRSVVTEALLNALRERSLTGRFKMPFPRSAIADADETADQSRNELEELYPQGQILYAEFRGIRQRKRSIFDSIIAR